MHTSDCRSDKRDSTPRKSIAQGVFVRVYPNDEVFFMHYDYGMRTEQPSNDELRQAYSNYVMTGTASWRDILNDLRDRRTTWFDTEELDLRRAIDRVLSP